MYLAIVKRKLIFAAIDYEYQPGLSTNRWYGILEMWQYNGA
jgi:hypothetical protein